MIEKYKTGTEIILGSTPPKRDVFEPSLDSFKDLYFKSQFKDLVSAVDAMDFDRISTEAYFRINLFKVSALFEMHRIEDAQNLIHYLLNSHQPDSLKSDFLHSLARLKYLDGDYDSAGQLWNELLQVDGTRRFHFRALLGIANVFYSQKRYEELPEIIGKLSYLTSQISLDEKLSYNILQGNYLWVSGESLSRAKAKFDETISDSVTAGWYYFLARGVYGLACVAQAKENLTALKVYLEMLDNILKNSDNKLLKHHINERFKGTGFSCTVEIDIDYDSKRVLIDSQWFDFHKTPKLFSFFVTLYKSKTFVTKEILANVIWPDENYKPRTHDPRIFNIAKRVRSTIEAYGNQPIVVLSGRFGYKLSMRLEK